MLDMDWQGRHMSAGIPTTHEVRTPDGRSLAVTEGGDPGGTPVLVHHGTPSAGMFDPLWLDLATEQGIRLVTWDRAGYGGSSRRPGRDVAAAAEDAATVADALAIEQFLTWGLSGGGPHALACGALLPDRVPAVAVLSGIGPYGVPGLDWLAGMGQDNIEEFGATLAGEPELRRYLNEACQGREEALLRGRDAVLDDMATLLSAPDARYFREHDWPLDSMDRELAPKYEGWLDDDLAFSRPWGFDLGRMTTKTLLLQGEQDFMVPPAHGRYLALAIPGAELRVFAEGGHMTMLDHLDEVHAWLLSALR
jgi:pimeloyl-ACP methyl ester carboxylesterase